MTARRIDEHRAGIARPTHGTVIGHTVFHGRHSLVVVGHDENGRGCAVDTHLCLVGIKVEQLLVGVLAQKILARAGVCAPIHRYDRIEENGKIRPGRQRGMSGQCGSQMPTGREAHDAHIVRIDAPHGCTVAHQTHGSLGISYRQRTVTVWHTIFQHEESNALTIEIVGPLMPLMFHGQMGITSTGTIYHGPPCGRGGQIGKELGFAVGRQGEPKLAGGFLCRNRQCHREKQQKGQ